MLPALYPDAMTICITSVQWQRLLKKIFICFWREGKGGKKREKHQCVVASYEPPLGTWPSTQACALTGNRTGNPLICSPRSIHWATPASPEAFNKLFIQIIKHLAHVFPLGLVAVHHFCELLCTWKSSLSFELLSLDFEVTCNHVSVKPWLLQAQLMALSPAMKQTLVSYGL